VTLPGTTWVPCCAIASSSAARSGISTLHRLRDGARVFRIMAVRESDGRRFLEIDAEERED
jgi:hypothetical protein